MRYAFGDVVLDTERFLLEQDGEPQHEPRVFDLISQVPLDTRNHLLRPDEPAWARLLAEVDAFLGEEDSTMSPRPVHLVSQGADP